MDPVVQNVIGEPGIEKIDLAAAMALAPAIALIETILVGGYVRVHPQTGFLTDTNSTPGYLTTAFARVSSPGSYQNQFSISPSDGWQVVMIGLQAPGN